MECTRISYGGFFTGDTITLTASPVDAPDERRDFTIDDYAFDNLRDRYQVTPGMALGLETDSDKVVHA